ncbi:MAG TPA: hypothetical protein VEI97_18570, partial [bacterium]|nr:hypothetical protein [bacterium]
MTSIGFNTPTHVQRDPLIGFGPRSAASSGLPERPVLGGTMPAPGVQNVLNYQKTAPLNREHPAIKDLAQMGTKGDNTIAHLTKGEMVLPREIQSPGMMALFAKHMRSKGLNPDQFKVGSPSQQRNPYTGAPMFGTLTGDRGGVSGARDDYSYDPQGARYEPRARAPEVQAPRQLVPNAAFMAQRQQLIDMLGPEYAAKVSFGTAPGAGYPIAYMPRDRTLSDKLSMASMVPGQYANAYNVYNPVSNTWENRHGYSGGEAAGGIAGTVIGLMTGMPMLGTLGSAAGGAIDPYGPKGI